jgi:ribosomal protein S18 acetylase RimI-like enzyme
MMHMHGSIGTGRIKKCRGRALCEPVSYDLRFLDISALQPVSNLQELVARSLHSPEIFRLHGDDYFKGLLECNRFVIGAIADNSLIAYSLVSIPGNGKENLGRDIGLSEGNLEGVAHLQATAVHPAYRGNGLQRAMVAAHLRVIEEMGFEHVLCTVSLKNPISLRNILSSGFVIKGLKPKFEGNWRYIMYKNLLKHVCPCLPATIIKSSDIDGQLGLLDKGYVGFDMKMIGDSFKVYYAQKPTRVTFAPILLSR